MKGEPIEEKYDGTGQLVIDLKQVNKCKSKKKINNANIRLYFYI